MTVPNRRDFHTTPDNLSVLRAQRPVLRTFSRWRWLLLCWAGLRHRRGEDFFQVERGRRMFRVSRCTRCGVKVPRRMAL